MTVNGGFGKGETANSICTTSPFIGIDFAKEECRGSLHKTIVPASYQGTIPSHKIAPDIDTDFVCTKCLPRKIVNVQKIWRSCAKPSEIRRCMDEKVPPLVASGAMSSN